MPELALTHGTTRNQPPPELNDVDATHHAEGLVDPNVHGLRNPN
jgi:hypothetical protein